LAGVSGVRVYWKGTIADVVHLQNLVDVKPRGKKGRLSRYEAETGHFPFTPEANADGRHDHHATWQTGVV
jgi:hypothetical protein